MKKIASQSQSPFGNKVVVIPAALLIALLSFIGGSEYQKRVQTIPEQQNSSNNQFQQLSTIQTVKRVIDGDTP